MKPTGNYSTNITFWKLSSSYSFISLIYTKNGYLFIYLMGFYVPFQDISLTSRRPVFNGRGKPEQLY